MSVQAYEWATKKLPKGLVSLPVRQVLEAFADHADEQGRAAYPSLSTVAWYLDCSERTVKEHVRTLIKIGLLVVSPDQSPAEDIPYEYRPVVYDLPLHWVRTDKKPERQKRGRKPKGEAIEVQNPSPPNELGVQDPSIRGAESFQIGVQNPVIRGAESCTLTVLEPSGKPPVEPSSSLARENVGHQTSFLLPLPSLAPEAVTNPDWFEIWWGVCPVKRNKADAREQFEIALTQTTPQALIAGMSAYRDDPTRDPHRTYYPATWLKKEKWDDEYEVPQRAGTQGDQKVARNAARSSDPATSGRRMNSVLGQFMPSGMDHTQAAAVHPPADRTAIENPRPEPGVA
ncbi:MULTISPECIES: helix-turn-helix domain-containing protein [Actinomycetes]|uniref:helix-turn-helix domain-containing protein n=1 Tax=Micromonospora sp. NPDC005367 TaxID=3155590 RepID=UPI0033BC6543